MGLGTNADPIQPLTSVLPGLNERPGGVPIMGMQRTQTTVLANKTAASTTYKVPIFVAPCDGWWIKEIKLVEIVKADYATSTLAIENYDKSASAGVNVLSTTNQDLEAAGITAKQGFDLTLTTTDSDRFMDEGDMLWATLALGAAEVAAGEGIAVSVVMVGPVID